MKSKEERQNDISQFFARYPNTIILSFDEDGVIRQSISCDLDGEVNAKAWLQLCHEQIDSPGIAYYAFGLDHININKENWIKEANEIKGRKFYGKGSKWGEFPPPAKERE